MISNIASCLVSLYFKHTENSENKQYQEVYQYVLFIILNYIFFFGYSLLFGSLLGIPYQSIIFFITIVALRRYAGGYHADTEKRCLVISSAYLLIGIILIKTMNLYGDRINFSIILSISALCSLVILFLCPCDSPSKPVEKERVKGIRIKCTAIILMIFIIMLFLVKFDKSQFISIFFSAIIIETILIIAGKIKNQKNLSH